MLLFLGVEESLLGKSGTWCREKRTDTRAQVLEYGKYIIHVRFSIFYDSTQAVFISTDKKITYIVIF